MDTKKSIKRKPSNSPPIKRRIKKIKDIEDPSESDSMKKQNLDSSNNSLRGLGFGITPANEKKGRGKKNEVQAGYITSYFNKGDPARVPERPHPSSRVQIIEDSFEEASPQKDMRSKKKEIPKAMNWDLEGQDNKGNAKSDVTEEIPEFDEDLLSNLNSVNLTTPLSNPPANSKPRVIPKPSPIKAAHNGNNGNSVKAPAIPSGPSATARPIPPVVKSVPKSPNTKKDYVPKSSSSIFEGSTFVFTGVMNSLNRDSAQDEVKALGGRCTGSVSSRTHYLVIGHILEDGRDVKSGKKYELAVKNKVTILTEDEFVAAVSKAKREFDGSTEMEIEIPKSSAPLPQPNSSTSLWTTKYAPSSTDHLVGNLSIINSVSNWLQNWDKIHIQGMEAPQQKSKGGWSTTNPSAKACLITGPPGIGKTTSVRLLAKEMGFALVEKNSSEQRNKACMNTTLLNLKDNQILTTSLSHSQRKIVILMDEVDGMSSGDRGGIQALIENIKTTKIPIICIANDHSSPKLKSLINHCYDLRFTRPSKQMIAKRLLEICRNEGLQTDINTLELVCENMGNDLRQILSYLEMKSKVPNSILRIGENKKDESVMINNFDAATKLLNRSEFSKLSIKDRISLFFIDYDMIPMIFQENYISSMSKGECSANDLENLALASECIAESDIVSCSMRKINEWSLITNFAFTSTIYPGQLVSQIVPFAKFPEFFLYSKFRWFGKNSTTRKILRLLKELRSSISTKATGNRWAIKFDYAPSLQYLLSFNLGKLNDVEASLRMLENYNLDPVSAKEILSEVQFTRGGKVDAFAKIPTATKTSLTKKFNSKHKSTFKAAKKKVKKGEELSEITKMGKSELEGVDEDYSDESEEESDVSKEEEFVPAKPKTKASKDDQGKKGKTKKGKAKIKVIAKRIIAMDIILEPIESEGKEEVSQVNVILLNESEKENENAMIIEENEEPIEISNETQNGKNKEFQHPLPKSNFSNENLRTDIQCENGQCTLPLEILSKQSVEDNSNEKQNNDIDSQQALINDETIDLSIIAQRSTGKIDLDSISVGQTNFSNFEIPAKNEITIVSLPNTITSNDAGVNDNDTKVYCFGSSECDQFPCDDDSYESRRPLILTLPLPFSISPQITKVLCGALHSVLLSSLGEVFTWGCNDDGVLGREGTESVPCKVPLLIPVDLISVGDSHCVAANSKGGLVFYWGVYRNTLKGNIGDVVRTPTPLWSQQFKGKAISKLLSGYNHTLLLSSGKVFAWGDPETYVLGRMPTVRRRLEQGLEIEAISCKNVLDMYSGGNHAFLKRKVKGKGKVEGNEILAWGLNNYGQLGVGSTENLLLPKINKGLSHGFGLESAEEVIDIKGGEHFSIAHLNSGRLLGFGRNEEGQLGFGELIDHSTEPKEISIANVKEIFTGPAYVYAKADKLYSWGSGDRYVLLTGKEDGVMKPSEVKFKLVHEENVLSLGLGSQHVTLVTGSSLKPISFDLSKKSKLPRKRKSKEERKSEESDSNSEFTEQLTKVQKAKLTNPTRIFKRKPSEEIPELSPSKKSGRGKSIKKVKK